MKPPKSILDRAFRYTPAALTDIRKTIRRKQAELAKLPENVVELPKKEKS